MTRPPAVETVLSNPGLVQAIQRLGRPVVTEHVRAAVARMRSQIAPGAAWPDAEEIIKAVKQRIAEQAQMFPRRVVNATGVLLHTNLGRTPWDAGMLAAISERLTSYLSLEYDLVTGARGRRGSAVEAELAALAGSESALIVNNNAAAVYLVLTALAWGKDVVISRGELVQIGGGFRIPEILAKSGARLREIGTTNRTTLRDYEAACGPQTALILKIHRSNFVQIGFVSEVEPKALSGLGKGRGIPVVWDVGSGAVGQGLVCEYSGDPTLGGAVASGVELVTASGDKLFGGPQAGIILGRADLIGRLRTDAFYRALRPGKGTLLALEKTVAAHRAGRASAEVPLYQLLDVSANDLRARAAKLAETATRSGWNSSVVATQDTFGGGAAPGKTIPGWGLRLDPPPAADIIAAAARRHDRPIVGTVNDQAVLFSLRTMFPQDDAVVAQFLSEPLPPI
ncbi:MAG: L-seryl-tRNA(Sec) selenium transferase [candidate division Zixibacteria bacterium]|nr:L-seryl-tRNA(Sec) selenium transferase [candidate division Zixibacteria bacterium]